MTTRLDDPDAGGLDEGRVGERTSVTQFAVTQFGRISTRTGCAVGEHVRVALLRALDQRGGAALCAARGSARSRVDRVAVAAHLRPRRRTARPGARRRAGSARPADRTTRKRSEGECSVTHEAHSPGRVESRSAPSPGRERSGRLRGGPEAEIAERARARRSRRARRAPASARPRPPISSSVMPAYIGTSSASCVEHGAGGHRAPHVEAEPLREVEQHLPLRPHLAGVPDRGPQPLEAAVGMRDGALLLGVGLGREHDVRVVDRRLAEELLVRDDEARLAQRVRPTARCPGSSRSGSLCSR